MSKIQRSFKELELLHVVAQEYVQKAVEKATELSIEAERLIRKQLVPLLEEYQEEVYMNQVRAAHKDDKGILQKSKDGHFLFTEDGELQRIKLNRELRKETREIHTRFVKDIPQGLTAEEKEVFAGIFWPLESEE